MALGILTKANATIGNIGPFNEDRVTIVGDGAYPTGGSVGLQAKLRTLFGDQRAIIGVALVNANGYTVKYDAANDKLLVFAANGSEVANSTNLAAVTFDLLVTSE